jgi:hypothetical protein
LKPHLIPGFTLGLVIVLDDFKSYVRLLREQFPDLLVGEEPPQKLRFPDDEPLVEFRNPPRPACRSACFARETPGAEDQVESVLIGKRRAQAGGELVAPQRGPLASRVAVHSPISPALCPRAKSAST